jgi:hypothetical protein
MTMIGKPRSAMRASGVELEIDRRSKGDPLLRLYSEEALELRSPSFAALAKTHKLIIPSPPGFGRSERPDWTTDPDDIAYISSVWLSSSASRACRCWASRSAARSVDRELPRTKPLSTHEATE